MGRLIYRMCLIVVLVIAVAGGVYYYRTFYGDRQEPQKGTFVYDREHSVPEGRMTSVQAAKAVYGKEGSGYGSTGYVLSEN